MYTVGTEAMSSSGTISLNLKVPGVSLSNSKCKIFSITLIIAFIREQVKDLGQLIIYLTYFSGWRIIKTERISHKFILAFFSTGLDFFLWVVDNSEIPVENWGLDLFSWMAYN